MPSKLKADTRDLKLYRDIYSLLIDFGYFRQKIILYNYKTFVSKLIGLCTYDLQVRGFVASNEVVLVESIATPTLLLSLPDGFPGFKINTHLLLSIAISFFILLAVILSCFIIIRYLF